MNADELTDLWERRWTRCPPVADQLRTAYPERWVRFHSLPGSKRYAANEAEYLEILTRHHSTLGALGAAADSPVLAITAQFSATRDAFARVPELGRVQPAAWHWRAEAEMTELESESMWRQLFVSETTVGNLDALLRLVADDGCRGVMIVPLDVSWVYHPYDGGADVLAPSESARNQLRSRFSNWLSTLASGM